MIARLLVHSSLGHFSPLLDLEAKENGAEKKTMKGSVPDKGCNI